MPHVPVEAVKKPGEWPALDPELRFWVAHLFLRFVQKGWGWFSLVLISLFYGRMVRPTRELYCLTFTEQQYKF